MRILFDWKGVSVLIFVLSCSAHAVTKSEFCEMRGLMIEGLARARDSGMSKQRAVAEARKSLGKMGATETSGMQAYADLVWANPKKTPSSFRLAGEVSCLQE